MTAAFLAASGLAADTAERSRRIEYSDLSPAVQGTFAAAGITRQRFPAYIDTIETDTDRRVAEGQREHLIYYALQSRRFTDRPPIEPAVSALHFVQRLGDEDRKRLLDDPSYHPGIGWPSDEKARVGDFLRALGTESRDARFEYFREVLHSSDSTLALDSLYPDYVRVARFLYRKEFTSGGASPADIAAVGRLYQTRPHSSDTRIDAGFGVWVALGALHALQPDARILRALVVGPGLDLAPRTDLVDAVEPQSYQPFAVADALIAQSLASERDLRVHSVDVNPAVVDTLKGAARRGATLHLFTGMTETAEQPFQLEYRTYVRQLGLAIGDEVAAPEAVASNRLYQHSIAVRSAVLRTITAQRLNIITSRPAGEAPYDIVIATNVFIYFDDRQLALALSNISGILRPGGYLVHNESRAGLVETAVDVGLPLLQMRTAVLGGPPARPLYDTVWLHKKP